MVAVFPYVSNEAAAKGLARYVAVRQAFVEIGAFVDSGDGTPEEHPEFGLVPFVEQSLKPEVFQTQLMDAEGKTVQDIWILLVTYGD